MEHSLDEISQWLHEPRLRCYESDGGALTTWDDEGIASCQVVRVPDLDEIKGRLPRARRCAGEMLCGFMEEGEVLEEASLEGQDTDSSRHCFVESSV